jgi:hypothetical protein
MGAFAQSDIFVPLRFCQLFSRSFSLFVERWDLFLPIAVLWYIPNVLLLWRLPNATTMATAFEDAAGDDATNADAGEDAAEQQSQEQEEAVVGEVFARLYLGLFLTTLISIMARTAISMAVAAMYNRGNPKTIWCLQKILSMNFIGLLGAFLFLGVGSSVCFSVCMIIVMILWISNQVIFQILGVLIGVAVAAAFLCLALAFTIIVPVVMIEQKGPVHGVTRTFELLVKDFCLVFGVLLLLNLAGFTISEAMTRLPLDGFLGAAVKSLPSLFLLPFDAILITVVYFNIRITREGLNQDVLAQELKIETSPHDPLVIVDNGAAKNVAKDGEMV